MQGQELYKAMVAKYDRLLKTMPMYQHHYTGRGACPCCSPYFDQDCEGCPAKTVDGRRCYRQSWYSDLCSCFGDKGLRFRDYFKVRRILKERRLYWVKKLDTPTAQEGWSSAIRKLFGKRNHA